jgi:hypothetical protein
MRKSNDGSEDGQWVHDSFIMADFCKFHGWLHMKGKREKEKWIVIAWENIHKQVKISLTKINF